MAKNNQTETETTRTTSAKAGKYLTFQLGAEEYGLEILKVKEIIGLMEITAVPRTPHYVRGVINLRGKVIPVIELRSKFDMETTEDTDQTCIIVVEVASDNGAIQTGVVVDAVSEVLDITEDQIENAPSFGTGVDTEFILGIGKIREEVKILLDIDKVIDVDIVTGFTDSYDNQMQDEEISELVEA